MHLGYNTNGMAHHGLFDAVALLAEIGYRSVAITIDHGVLEPNGSETAAQLRRLGPMLEQLHMRSVIETGARFLLDPRHKHAPTLVSADRADRARRIEFTRHAIDCAAELRSDCVSLWSGAADDSAPRAEAMDRLVEGLGEVLEYAQRRSVKIGFEPEPGMLIDSMERFEALLGRLDAESLHLTLDIGHLHCQGEAPIAEYVRRWAPRLVNVHIEDMRAGVHEHLMFGQGEIDFPPVLRALAETRYSGGIHVELSRHGHEAPEAAQRAMAFLRPMVKEILV
jgi:sugar phosphate isomerase/epimerase